MATPKKLKLNTKRAKVYLAIDSERQYQEKLVKDQNRPDIIENFGMGDALGAIRYNLDQASNVWYKDAPPYKQTSEFLRKIAGIVVKIGEVHGIPERK